MTPSSSNHYFYADEKAHCSETWQDWFCIPNYHNNNKVNKYPFTKTMSVGVCYDYCAKGSNGKYMTIKNKTNCEVYDDEDEVLHAVSEIKAKGIKIEEVFTPFPIH